MSIALQDHKHASNAIELTTPYWLNLLKSATQFGWKPLGTIVDIHDSSIPVNKLMKVIDKELLDFLENIGDIKIL